MPQCVWVDNLTNLKKQTIYQQQKRMHKLFDLIFYQGKLNIKEK